MESLDQKVKRIEYYQELLLEMMDNHHFPVYELIIKNKLTKKETEELFQLCEELSQEYEEQKEEGLLHFDSLLTHFVGMLNYKLDPKKTIEAFYQQNLYKSLMEEFLKLIKSNV